MIKVGITGQAGFIGTHFYNYLGLDAQIERISFEKDFFDSEKKLIRFVDACDVVVHMAGANRNDNPDELYRINVELMQRLLAACDKVANKPRIIFASSIQEERTNPYGLSKFKARQLMEEWAHKNGAKGHSLIIPNVFGPFGRPFYNSVIATFCYQLTHGQQPQIDVDGELSLIYINELVDKILILIKDDISPNKNKITIEYTKSIKVSGILTLLENFKTLYLDKGIIPELSDPFQTALFNTFRSYIDRDYFPVKYTCHSDERGIFVELVKSNASGQFSYSTTKPGITRGNHFHLRKVERFSVIKGEALIQLRRIGTSEVINYKLSGEEPAYVDMPVWYSHNIKNIGNDELLTAFWINEPYDPADPDTYFEKV